MSSYWLALTIAAVALLALAALVVRTVTLVRRFRVLVAAYRRYLAAESAGLRHRHEGLLIELARRRGRAGEAAPRTIR